VAQGEIPSPLIYAVFVNLVFQALERAAQASTSGRPTQPRGAAATVCDVMRAVHTIMFADDMVLVASSPKQLQEQLDCLSDIASKLRFEVSCTKTKIMVFRPTGSQPEMREWTLRMGPSPYSRRVKVPVVDQFRYLGVTLTYNLTWGPHINRMLAVASRRASAVRSMVHSYNVAEAWLARTAACIVLHHGPHPRVRLGDMGTWATRGTWYQDSHGKHAATVGHGCA